MSRYSRITSKRPREIVLLQGAGCAWRRCTFCDYHLDAEPDPAAAFATNGEALAQVSGCFHELEVINSGSVFELDDDTLGLIECICEDRGITTLHFESHWRYRARIPELRERFSPVRLKLKLGLETFDWRLREHVWHKGIPIHDPRAIAAGFDEANLLAGVEGQTLSGVARDIELALALFERVCVNVMCANSTAVRPDPELIGQLVARVLPRYADDPRVDVLVDNTGFGVGGEARDD